MDKSFVLPHVNYNISFVNVKIPKLKIKKFNVNDILLLKHDFVEKNNRVIQIHYNDKIHSQR